MLDAVVLRLAASDLARMTHDDQLARAREHLLHLRDEERRYLESLPFRLVHEHDMRAGRYLVRAVVQHAVPPNVLGTIESIARELRASLDTLASLLAGAPARFPIFESLPMFAQRARKSLKRMPDEAQAAIEALQPYHAIGGFQNGPLWLLDQLASADRPRLAAGAIREGAEFGVNTRRKIELSGDMTVTAGAFDDGAVVAAVQSKVVGPDPKLDMYLKADFALAFEKRGPAKGREVVELLGELGDHVGEIFKIVNGEP